MVADEVARRLDGSWRGKFSGDLADIRLEGARLALLKPQTYMNESGSRSALRSASSRRAPSHSSSSTTRSTSSPGGYRRGFGGGLAGHNGLRSIAQHVGTPDFARLRVGVGRPERGDPRPVADFRAFSLPPELDVETLVSRAADAVETIAREGSRKRSRNSTSASSRCRLGPTRPL